VLEYVREQSEDMFHTLGKIFTDAPVLSLTILSGSLEDSISVIRSFEKQVKEEPK